MDRALGCEWQHVAQRREPAQPGALVVLAGSEQQVRRAVVVYILAVNSILDVDWALAFAQCCRIGSEEVSCNMHEMAYWASQKGDQSDKAEAECGTECHAIEYPSANEDSGAKYELKKMKSPYLCATPFQPLTKLDLGKYPRESPEISKICCCF